MRRQRRSTTSWNWAGRRVKASRKAEMSDYRGRAAARLESVVREMLDADNRVAGRRAAEPMTVHAGRDVVIGADRWPSANDDHIRRSDPASHAPELHYALLGLVSFAVVLLIVVVVLLARRDFRPIKPSVATQLSAAVAVNPYDATLFLFFLVPMALKASSNALFSPLHPAVSRHIPHRSNHLSCHRLYDGLLALLLALAGVGVLLAAAQFSV